MLQRDKEIDTTPGSGSEVSRYINRELSWLEFANRLLDLASDPTLPLLERARFLGIFSGGLDEFFQVRVAGLKDQVAAGLTSKSTDGMTPGEQLEAICTTVCSLIQRQSAIYLREIVPGLRESGLVICDYADLQAAERDQLRELFDTSIYPVLTPLAVDPGHPFPYISNLSLNLAVTVTDPVTGEARFSRVKVPPLLPRYLPVGPPDAFGPAHRPAGLDRGSRGSTAPSSLGRVPTFVPLEQVIAAHLDALFPDMDIGDHYCFRVTRNADLTLEEEEAEDLLSALEMELRRRRFGRAVRLELDEAASDDVRDLLARELEIETRDIFDVEGPLDMGGLWSLCDLDFPLLLLEPWVPVTPPRLTTPEGEPADIFAALRERDILVHHPYESFAGSVEAFITAAAADPDVLAIKQTLYRTAGDSPIIKGLIHAAESGKQVAVLVELKARFDEQRNITWAKALEEAGVHVVYGVMGLKTHAKTCLVVRVEDGVIRRYCHIGTGNYNASTARVYEDIGILSSSPRLGAELTQLFNFLTGFSRLGQYDTLVVAPVALRTRLIELIAEQAKLGTEGRIVIKVNGLTDPAVIDAFYDASQCGVPIDLIVRGVCMLRPGVTGLSETIRVRSIVGRFLEHSRVYAFGNSNHGNGNDAIVWIGSADMMERNLEHRVEVVVPVDDPELRRRLLGILELNLEDDTSSWILAADGSWTRLRPVLGICAQSRLAGAARENEKPPLLPHHVPPGMVSIAGPIEVA